jgi:signal recognition particle subunit SEC65
MHRQLGLDFVNNMIVKGNNPRLAWTMLCSRCGSTANPLPNWRFSEISELIIGGGFDTTTKLTAHSLEWLSEHPDQRELLQQQCEYSASRGRRVPALLHPSARRWPDVLDDVDLDVNQFKEVERPRISWAMADRGSSVSLNETRSSSTIKATGTSALDLPSTGVLRLGISD